MQRLPAKVAIAAFHPTFSSASGGGSSQRRWSSETSSRTRTSAPFGSGLHFNSRLSWRSAEVTATRAASAASSIQPRRSSALAPACRACWLRATPSCIQDTAASWNSAAERCSSETAKFKDRRRSFLAPSKSGPGEAVRVARMRPRSEKKRMSVSGPRTPPSTSSLTVCLAVTAGTTAQPIGRFVVGLVSFLANQRFKAERS
mmetsp:Transcript_615/g.1710  ORF Transcript_615/g.1710 Transcript_615/m.1710 type:complete len:202 (-) Transcript_615:350-955(-)